ncbi:MAG: hydrogenase 2 operon protein HybA [Anaerolineales bacterium]|nr:hydrogenase 2 operon protein HybA [Chloroflexota bacterium]MBL6982452.1 hydrogenase 2 operon protein HybA [Anaerolineales bacterium]
MPPINRRQFLKIAGLGLGGALLTPKVACAAANGGDPNKHIGMLYDSTLCVGCNACTVACRDWNGTPVELDETGKYDMPYELTADTWTLMQIYQGSEKHAFVKRQCMHCVDPGCVSGCPVHALEKTANGPVTYDADRCIGCRYCMYACPYHVPRFEWDETLPLIAKCTLCDDRLANGDGPACAEICPTGALIWGERGNLLEEAEGRIAAEPDRYVDYVYGKDEAGGTSVFYLSDVDYENLGLENFGPDPIPKISEETGNLVIPTILIGGPLVLAAVRSISKREGWEESWPF